MTRITQATLTRVRLHFRVSVRYGDRTLSSQEVGILQVTTDGGLVGLGEVPGPTLPTGLESELERTRRTLLGRDPAHIDSARGVLGAAVDTAILDLRGQLEGRSMADLLGGDASSVAVNALLVMTGSPAVDVAAARALVDAGSGAIKLKLAIGGRAVDESLSAIRAAVGREVQLRLDMNGALGEADAIRWLGGLAGLDLDYVEQPVASHLGVETLARVRRSIPMPLAADESVADAAAAAALLDAGACDVLVVKPARVGGPRKSVRIARDAAAAGVKVTISTLYESGIGLAAALHVAATVPGDRAHGLGTGELLVTDLVGGRSRVVRGRMAVPAGTGLGVTLDAATAARSPVPA